MLREVDLPEPEVGRETLGAGVSLLTEADQEVLPVRLVSLELLQLAPRNQLEVTLGVHGGV